MFTAKLALLIGLAVPGQPGNTEGVIRGIVVNASDREAPCPQTEVVLRVQVEGQFVPVEETVTDSEGKFAFTNLPVDSRIIYLPGANRDEIHYPGQRLRLDARKPEADVTLIVRNAVAEPCPLVIRNHEIVLHTEPGAVHVTEGMLVDNPGSETYVGCPPEDGLQPITLRLGIPADFERITFEKEAFGREFAVVNNQLSTGIPWMPGRRWLRFTYTLRNEDAHRLWERTVDAPCERIILRVVHDKPDEVRCNLGPGAIRGGEYVVESDAAILAEGQKLQVEFGVLPVPWFLHARWIALGVLAGLIAVAAIVSRRTRRDRRGTETSTAPQADGEHHLQIPSRSGKSRRKRKRRLAA